MSKRNKQIEEEEDEEEDNVIQVGDIVVHSKRADLNKCLELTKTILKDRTIRKYLGYSFPKKKLLTGLTGIG